MNMIITGYMITLMLLMRAVPILGVRATLARTSTQRTILPTRVAIFDSATLSCTVFAPIDDFLHFQWAEVLRVFVPFLWSFSLISLQK